MYIQGIVIIHIQNEHTLKWRKIGRQNKEFKACYLSMNHTL